MSNPGEFDQQIDLKGMAQVDDGHGGHTEDEVCIARCVWARIKPLRFDEKAEFGKSQATELYSFTIWNRQDITAKSHIVWNGQKFNIRGVQRRGNNAHYLQIIAEAGVII